MDAKALGATAAYPITADHERQNLDCGWGSNGLTKREAFAMAAMQGMAMRVKAIPDFEVAAAAVYLADALLAELAKEQP